MSEVNTSTMAPAVKRGQRTPPNAAPAATPPTAQTSDGALTPDAAPPKPRRARRAAKPKAKELAEPSAAQLRDLGKLTYDAHQLGVTVDEYVDGLRGVVEAYDAVFGTPD